MKQKAGALFLTTLLLMLFSLTLISAANPLTDLVENINPAIEKGVEIIEPIAKQLLGDTPSGELLFAKILFLIIIFAIVWAVLSRVDFFTENTWVLVTVTIAVSILSTRFLGSDALINTLILPYSTLAIAISAGLPFVLYALIVNVGLNGPGYKTVRRIAWIFFAIIFIGLWFSRYDLIITQNSNAGWIYPAIAILSLAMAAFDGTIRKFLVSIELDKIGKDSKEEAITELADKVSKLPGLVAGGALTLSQSKKLEKKYMKKIAYLSK